MKTRRFIAGIMTLSMLCTACVSASKPVSLFFFSDEDIVSASGKPSVSVQRFIDGSSQEQRMTNAIRALLKGPTKEEFHAGTRTTEDLRQLQSFFQEVRIDGSAARIAFTKQALAILNSAAARQGMAKAPIEETLLQFPGISAVEYVIDGEVFDAWDA